MDKEVEFRVNATSYANHQKFKAWLLHKVEQAKSQPSYDEYIDKKFGTAFAYNRPEDIKKYEPVEPCITHISKASFVLLGTADKPDKPQIAAPTSKKAKK